jgi:hypothetical protein
MLLPDGLHHRRVYTSERLATPVEALPGGVNVHRNSVLLPLIFLEAIFPFIFSTRQA